MRSLRGGRWPPAVGRPWAPLWGTPGRCSPPLPLAGTRGGGSRSSWPFQRPHCQLQGPRGALGPGRRWVLLGALLLAGGPAGRCWSRLSGSARSVWVNSRDGVPSDRQHLVNLINAGLWGAPGTACLAGVESGVQGGGAAPWPGVQGGLCPRGPGGQELTQCLTKGVITVKSLESEAWRSGDKVRDALAPRGLLETE